MNPPGDIVDADALQHIRRFGPSQLFRDVPVTEDRLGDLVPHGVDRRECSHGFLEHHADQATPKVINSRVLVGQRYDVEWPCARRREVDAPADNLSGGLDDSHDAIRGHGLAGPGFADDGRDLAPRHVETDIAQRLDRADICLEIDRQIADFQYVVRHWFQLFALLSGSASC